MAIEFTTREYIYENGRAPRGYGRWGFSFEGYEFWHTGKYGEAKKACRKEVKRLAPEGYDGFVLINVLP